MDHTFIGEKQLKTLEDYALFMGSALVSLMTLHNMQIRAIEAGIMPEDLNEKSNVIIWDLRRQLKMHREHLASVLQLLPDDFSVETVLNKLKDQEKKRAKSLLKKPKEKKCAT